MKLNTHHELNASIDRVFDALSNTDRWEVAARRRGVGVVRAAYFTDLREGAAWDVKASFRGKPREIRLTLTELRRPERMVFSGTSEMFRAEVACDLGPIPAGRTRIDVSVDVKPNTLAGRIMLQSLALAKGKVQKRFAQRVGQLLKELDKRLVDPSAA
jgi:uncharacterized protein YndB with AHSA1/START domain